MMLGAPRTGSTALDGALRQHPGIFLPRVKESRFFSCGGDLSLAAIREITPIYYVIDDPAEYTGLFADAPPERLRGEIDPSILSRAVYAIPKMQEYLDDDTKFIIVLRQPVERAYSHYLLHVRLGIEPHSFARYVGLTEAWTTYEWIALDRYFGPGLYAETVKLFFEAFGRERFLVLLYDDLVSDQQHYLRRILAHLGADTRIVPSMQQKVNAGVAPRTVMGKIRGEKNLLHRWVRKYVPNRLRAVGRRAVGWDTRMAKDFSKPALAPELRVELMGRYREDILQTQDLIERDLRHWL